MTLEPVFGHVLERACHHLRFVLLRVFKVLPSLVAGLLYRHGRKSAEFTAYRPTAFIRQHPPSLRSTGTQDTHQCDTSVKRIDERELFDLFRRRLVASLP